LNLLSSLGVKKEYSSEIYLGCSIPFLKNHLESKFLSGMSWDNHGEWHIDHIVPCAYFDLTKKESQLICFNYANLQPLWAGDNIAKRDKLPENHKEILAKIHENLLTVKRPH
jgi:hypothetical protein